MNANILVGLFTFGNFNQYTGIEHTRIAEMLFVLAGISLVMWIAVCLSMVARVSAKLLLKLDLRKSLQPQSTPEAPEPNVSSGNVTTVMSSSDKINKDVQAG